MTTPRLHLLVRNFGHFVEWERAAFARSFTLVDEPGPGVVVHGVGFDVIDELLAVPARHRSLMLYPGTGGPSPFHDPVIRDEFADRLVRLDRLFLNPGPLAVAFAELPNVALVDFSAAIDRCSPPNVRTALDSLIHASADRPEKDWRRNEAIMAATGLRHEVFPPRDAPLDEHLLPSTRWKRRINARLRRLRIPVALHTPPSRYIDQSVIIDRIRSHDGYVHVAAPVPPGADALYTAAFIEAGATGAILFWHDTLGIGGFLETPFELPLDPDRAAERILDVRGSIDVARHSRMTHDEMAERFHPDRTVAQRCEVLLRDLDDRREADDGRA